MPITNHPISHVLLHCEYDNGGKSTAILGRMKGKCHRKRYDRPREQQGTEPVGSRPRTVILRYCHLGLNQVLTGPYLVRASE
jgi:hypothetical protein